MSKNFKSKTKGLQGLKPFFSAIVCFMTIVLAFYVIKSLTNSTENNTSSIEKDGQSLAQYSDILLTNVDGTSSSNTNDISSSIESLFSQKISTLQNLAFNTNDNLSGRILYDTDKSGYVVFISICDIEQKATVFHANASTLSEAWDEAVHKAYQFISDNNYNTLWVKADVVNSMNSIDASDFPEYIDSYISKFMRQGISFDNTFQCAFLEAELNGSNLISYSNNKINENNIKKYLKRTEDEGLFPEVAQKLTLFTTIGFICGEDNIAYELGSDYNNYGRRKINTSEIDMYSEIVDSSAKYLAKMSLENGKFLYGYYPISNREIDDYNILRHSGTMWSLINQYAMTKDESLIPIIEKGMAFLIENIEYPTEEMAYVIEHNANEVKLGGNAIALLAFISYMEAFETDIYIDLTKQLAEGVFSLMDLEKGTFYHVLNYPDYTKKAEVRTIYYDGEAAYALARMYGLTKDEKYLNATTAAADNFIRNNYEQHVNNQWVAYAMNELTKFSPEDKYFEFGLKNLQTNLKYINEAETTYHIFFEFLLATFELYERTLEISPELPYLKEFDEEFFIETIFHRADYQLNGYFYPEYAMYMTEPKEAVDTFFVRNDSYRIRIDDIQHNIGGYHLFIKHFYKLKEYQQYFGLKD